MWLGFEGNYTNYVTVWNIQISQQVFVHSYMLEGSLDFMPVPLIRSELGLGCGRGVGGVRARWQKVNSKINEKSFENRRGHHNSRVVE